MRHATKSSVMELVRKSAARCVRVTAARPPPTTLPVAGSTPPARAKKSETTSWSSASADQSGCVECEAP